MAFISIIITEKQQIVKYSDPGTVSPALEYNNYEPRYPNHRGIHRNEG